MNFKDLPKIIMLIIALIGFVVILSNALNSSPDWLLVAMVILLIVSILYEGD